MQLTQKHAPLTPRHTLDTVLGVLLALLVVLLCATRVHSQTSSEPISATQAITTLLARPNSPLPPGTQLRSLRVENGLATVNFSRELVDNFPGGDSQEVAAVNDILRAVGRDPSVNKVQILVEGQRVDSLGGLISLSDPLPVVRTPAPARRLYFHRRGTPSHHQPASRHRQSLT